MKTTQFLAVAVSALGLTGGAVAQNNNNNNNNNNNANSNNNNAGNNAGGNNDLLLLEANVQAASNFIGNPNAQQANSNTDPANFINFCTGKTLTNGTQVTGGSCNGVVMGDIPSNNNMISAVVLFPGPGEDVTPNQDFDIQVQLTNLIAGSFTDPLTTYYAAPQQLQGGKIVGHCHVTVQTLGDSLAPTQPPDAKLFAFFKGINDDGNGNGLLSATVTGGLAPGFYRVCTMNSASNHQPALMPVAQRGAQDDCQKFTVGQGNGNNGGNAGNTGNNGGNAGGNNGGSTGATTSAVDQASTTSAAAEATTTSDNNGNGSGNNSGNNGNNGNSGNSGGNGGVTTTAASAVTTTAAAASSSTTSTSTSGRGGSGRFGGGRGRFWRERSRFAAREYVA